MTISTKHLHHSITVPSLQPPSHSGYVFCPRTKNRLGSESVAGSSADSEEHSALSGLSWAALVQLSQLKPVSSQELSWGKLHTHSIENWDLLPTALPQHPVGMRMRSLLRSSCRGKALLKPNSVICNHLPKPLGFFCRTFPVLSHLSLCGSLKCWLCCVQGQVLPRSASYCASAHWV